MQRTRRIQSAFDASQRFLRCEARIFRGYTIAVMSNEKPVHIPRDQYPEAMYPQIVTPSIAAEYQTEREIHLLDYWRVLAARRWTILAILSTFVVATMIYTFRQVPVYQASSTIQ